MSSGIDDVLCFWFEETTHEQRFKKDSAFDAAIRDRFGALHAQAEAGGCTDWAASARGALALLVLLDQFSRNLNRDSARAFACDGMARAVADQALERGFDLEFPVEQRLFFYLPFEHSEDMADQERCCRLVRERVGDANSIDFTERHRDVIRRFGRFPHRNKALGRSCTPAEEDYLAQPGAGF
ncbi:MAG: DUF924 family protein [Candidatus Eiseniibacteriota bacterium]